MRMLRQEDAARPQGTQCCQSSGLLGEVSVLQALSSKAGVVVKSPPSLLSSSVSAFICGFDPAHEDSAEGEQLDRDGATTG